MKISRTSLTRLFPPATTTVGKGHGRLEVCSLRSTAILNDYVEFPHVKQVLKIVRTGTE